jgi:hypothetical protein
MPDQIRDGKGRGHLAGVNSDNQLITRATTVEQRLHSTIDQLYYEAYTGLVTLSNATETGFIYIKNSDKTGKHIVIDRIFYDFWTSTGGTGSDGYLRYYINPVISSGTTIMPVNTNFSSTSEPSGTFERSFTIDSGSVWWTAYITDKSSTALEEGRIAIPDGNSFAISVQAPTGNTSMQAAINIAFYYFDPDLV